jgi:ribosomal protein L11 methyltransferase
MFYTRLAVECDAAFSEILMAEIAEAGFDSFMETEKGFEAYVESGNFDAVHLQSIKEKYGHVNPLSFLEDKILKQNWNEEWEKNLETIIVDDQCLIRAEFHKVEKKYPYEIIITPKMSFGTGHHQTTWLMIKKQMQMVHEARRVMDAGCGTAILSIMACKLGAASVEAFDIDEWSVINGKENIANNHCDNINIQLGKLSELRFAGKFDIILANINKNILLAEIGDYSNYLAKNGSLLVSGFYLTDAKDLEKEALHYGLVPVSTDERETWAAILFRKQ